MGCGRGAVLFPLARAVGESGRVTGIDLAPQMVEATKAEAATLGLDVDVRVDDASSPDLAVESFDLVASSLVLFFLPDPLAALRAWRSLLVEGGRLGVSTFGDYGEGWRQVDDILRRYQPPGACGARGKGTSSPFASDAGVEQLLSAAGLTGVRTETVTVPVRFRDPDHFYEWSWSVGQRRTWEAVPHDAREDVRVAVYAQLERCRDATGAIRFYQVVRLTMATRSSD